jgi:Flp pilus assembly protein TadG
VLPALALVVVVLFGVARAIGDQLAVEDAARVGARAAARGESPAEVQRLVTSVAPRGATVSVAREGGLVTVVVRVDVRPLGSTARFLPDLTVRARAVAADESELSSRRLDGMP